MENTCMFCGKKNVTGFCSCKDAYGMPIAILSTTIIPLDGCYEINSINISEIPDLTGISHYIGHPTTKEIVESFGAVKAPTNLFKGLEKAGEYALCFSIKQGMSTRKEEGFTTPHQNVDLSMLDVRVLKRRFY